MAQSPARNDAAGPTSDPVIADKLREIVSIRQRLAEVNERAVKAGRRENDGPRPKHSGGSARASEQAAFTPTKALRCNWGQN